MAFNQPLSSHERSLLEHELLQFAHAQANQQAALLTRHNDSFFPATAAGVSSLASSGSSARDALLGLGNFSNGLHAAVPPRNTALDAAAAMLMARSQSMSARSNLLPSAFGLGGLSGPLGLASLGFRSSMTGHGPSIGALQLEFLRAEHELNERRQVQVLELQIRARAAAQQQQQQQQQQAATQQSQDLKKLMLLQNAACSVKEDSASSSSSGEEEEQEDSSCRTSSSSGSHQYRASSSEQKHGENSQEKESNRSTFAPIRKHGTDKAIKIGGKHQPESKKKKGKHEPGQKNKSKWNSYFETLKAYKEENGDCCVPRGFSENPKLASWVSN